MNDTKLKIPNKGERIDKFELGFLWCSKCLDFKEKIKFGLNKNNTTSFGFSSHCKVCLRKRYNSKKYKASRRKRAWKSKKYYVYLLGGCCAKCGYSQYMCSLEFHHIDPQKKIKRISKCLLSKYKVRSEVDKCVLLCSNCHRAFESGYWTATFEKSNQLGWIIKKDSVTQLKRDEVTI